VWVSDRSVKAFFTILLMASAAAVSFGAVSNPVTAEKHSTTLTCEVSPKKVNLGLNVTVSGRIVPLIKVPVTLTFIRPDGTSLQRSTWTEIAVWDFCFYSYTFTPDMEGVWRVYASWPGNDEYYGATSEVVNFTVLPPIILTRIYLTLSRTELTIGETLELTGRLVAVVNGSETPLGGVVVTFALGTPAVEHSLARAAITESDGTFSITFRPSTLGEWVVRAYWDGNETYAGCSTDQYSFKVLERKFPIVEVAVGGVVAVVVLVVALKFLRRRGRS